MALTTPSPLEVCVALLGLSLVGAAGTVSAAGAPGAAGAVGTVGTAGAPSTGSGTRHGASTSAAKGKGRSTRFAKPTGPTTYDAASLRFDYPKQYGILEGNVVVTEGDLRVTADRAEAQGLNPNSPRWTPFIDSRWTFTGNVHIRSELQGNLESDTATINWGESQMKDAVVTGNPATFEQTTSTTGVLARGHANTIVYTVATGTVRLTDDAWLKYGDNETNAPVLVYNIKTQQLQGAGRVSIKILPKESPAGQGTAAPSAPKPGGSHSAVKPGTPP